MELIEMLKISVRMAGGNKPIAHMDQVNQYPYLHPHSLLFITNSGQDARMLAENLHGRNDS
jgi:hypothetical protein